MQWFMKEYEEKQKEYLALKEQGINPENEPSTYHNGLSVLAKEIANKLGPEYSWRLMGPFGTRASSSLWFTKTGEDMLKDGGYSLDVCPGLAFDGSAAFHLSCGGRDFAGNPTKWTPMPETLEETFCLLHHSNPMLLKDLESVSVAAVVVPEHDLYVLKNLLSIKKEDAVEIYKDTLPEIASLLKEGKDITYSFSFDDGFTVDLNIGSYEGSNDMFLYAALYDNNQNLILGKEIENPALSFPGEFHMIHNNKLYCASFCVLLERGLYPAGYDKFNPVHQNIDMIFSNKELDRSKETVSSTEYFHPWQQENPNKWFLEVVQDFDGSYYANMTINGARVMNLPENVDYNTLRDAIKKETGIEILKHKDMKFKQMGRKKYAYIDNTQERNDCRVTLDEIINGWRPDFKDSAQKESAKPSLDTIISSAKKQKDLTYAKNLFLFEENRSGNRLGKPGDGNNVYFANWYEYYMFDENNEPKNVNSILEFSDKNNPADNINTLKQEVYDSFCKQHSANKVVVLNMEWSKKDLKERMNEAIQKPKIIDTFKPSTILNSEPER